ncbi:putative defective in cullin neddylation 1 protein [Blattamonas nauphoetae]|uniref:Defective in cullin neddylation protein n=1 Tax=Blattamonas nauphoetae TaxID=2049346 RepID=A0ABQ9XU19_9EUKA|nr:putative defective in cullin neddylation 1 protein [Blattamonas nauphoetae]
MSIFSRKKTKDTTPKAKPKTSTKVETPKPKSSVAAPSPTGAQTLFNKYAIDVPEEHIRIIDAENLLNLLTDLSIEPEDLVSLIIAWQFGCKRPYQFSEEEFITGCKKFGITDISSFQKKLPHFRSLLKGDEEFNKFYLWSFSYFADSESVHRLPTETVLGMIQLILVPRYPQLGKFAEFVETELVGSKPNFQRDAWNQLVRFATTIKKDFSNYSEEDAWHTILDDYVEWRKEKK